MIKELLAGVLAQYSFGLPVYLRVITETGGDASLKIPGVKTQLDYPVLPRPSMQRVSSAKANYEQLKTGGFKVYMLFGAVATEALFNSAAGVVIGGTYNAATFKVTGGKFYSISHDTVMKTYLDSSTASGAEFHCFYKGD